MNTINNNSFSSFIIHLILLNIMKSYQEIYKAAQKANATKSLNPVFHQWGKEGETIIGAFVSKAAIPSRTAGNTYFQYQFETDDGLIKFALGGPADSDFGDRFTEGIVYAITYQGKGRSLTGNEFNLFEVEEISLGDYGPSVPEKAPKGDS